jgi:hypothetical protein
MDLEMLQHAIVTLTAAGAAWVVFRRVFSVMKPTAGPKCASCPSATAAQRSRTQPTRHQELGAEAKPLTLIR